MLADVFVRKNKRFERMGNQEIMIVGLNISMKPLYQKSSA